MLQNVLCSKIERKSYGHFWVKSLSHVLTEYVGFMPKTNGRSLQMEQIYTLIEDTVHSMNKALISYNFVQIMLFKNFLIFVLTTRPKF